MVREEEDSEEDETRGQSSVEESFSINAVKQRFSAEPTELLTQDTGTATRKVRKDSSKSRWREVLRIGGHKVMVAIETGAQCSLLPRSFVAQVLQNNKTARLFASKTKLMSYFNDEHHATECIHLSVSHGLQRLVEKFYVVTPDLMPTVSGECQLSAHAGRSQ